MHQDKSQRLIAPNEARLRNLTYESKIYVDMMIRSEKETGEVEVG
jgi:DNA-directed RNA polymerase beta subunit